MDDATLDEPLGTRAARWLRPSPAELLGLAILLLGAVTASGVWWFQAMQRPAPVVGNGAIAVGTGVEGGPGAGDGPVVEPGYAASPESDPGEEAGVGSTDHPAAVGASSPLTVHVSGAVRRPGLVTVPADSRVGDAVAAAGGIREDGLVAAVNLARTLTDGEQVHVPAEGETVAPGPTGPPAGPPGAATGATGSPGIAADGRVDLNRATREELETLPGVGPARADAIVAHREEHGPFAVPGDLRGVRGIGEATFQALADLVTVG